MKVAPKEGKKLERMWQFALVGRAGIRVSKTGSRTEEQLSSDIAPQLEGHAYWAVAAYRQYMPPAFVANPLEHLIRAGAVSQLWPLYIKTRRYCLNQFSAAWEG